MRPVIGILGARADEIDPLFIKKNRSYENERYVKAVCNNGGSPLIIPYCQGFKGAHDLLMQCDGLIFSGGKDVNPRLYGEEPAQCLGPVDYGLDLFLYDLMRFAIEMDKPILAICKGMQLMNVALGGSLYQDLSLRDCESLNHLQTEDKSLPYHEVYLKENTRLWEILDRTPLIQTNSLHHQCVKKLGRDLIISSTSTDELVESFEDREGLRMGIQWHPEEMLLSDPHSNMNQIFKYFNERSACFKK